METPTSTTSTYSKRPTRRTVGLQNYNENLMDEVIEKHLGSVSKKRNKTMEDFQKETETEAMIALSLGFPIDTLLEEEIKEGVVQELGGIEQNNYIVVRNHILAKWRYNVRTWLSKQVIKETVSNEYEKLISSAYEFLLSHGYINFGVSHSISSRFPNQPTEGSVIIVGAGLAGLAAARQLLIFGFKVLVLEGRKRPGGRVYTQKMGRDGKYAALDLGGSVITGIHANPLGVLARQLSIPLHKVRDKCPLYTPDGVPVNDVIDSKVENIFNKLLDKATELRSYLGEFASDISLGSVLETLKQLYGAAKNSDERQLLDWHFANLEYANAGRLSNLSVAYWDQDDPYEMGGDHCLLAGGNWRLINALCKDVPILYGKKVHTIKYGKDGVEVFSQNQVFEADMILCTVPLGVLKNDTIRFEPELPKRKIDAIKRLGYGLLDKVAMLFPYVFWGEDLDTFGSLNRESHRRGEFFLFYSYHTVSGGAAMIALVAGEAAQNFEKTDPTTSLHRVLTILRGIFTPKGIDVPDPIQSICTRWGSDPLCFGSYSHVTVGSSGHDYDILAESVGDGRLFFAGEATSRQYPATMHGAFLSGLREASHIFHSANNSILDNKKLYQKNATPFIDMLGELFRTPNMEYGNFSFLFDSSSNDPKSMGLMRVLVGESTSKDESLKKGLPKLSSLPIDLYGIVSQEQAVELQDVNGEDECKLYYLYKNYGLKLVGRNQLGASNCSIIARIASSRRGRVRHLPGNSPCFMNHD